MIGLGFVIGAVGIGLVLYLPFFLWFRSREAKVKVKSTDTIAQDLEVSLHMAFVTAGRQRHASVSLAQLLLALLDNPRCADVLRACEVDIDALRTDVATIVRDTTPVVPGTDPVAPVPTPEFERVLQRAIVRIMAIRPSLDPRFDSTIARASLREPVKQPAVDGGDLLVAFLDEPDGAVADALRRHGVSRFDVTGVIAHGITGADPVAAPQLETGGLSLTAVVLENDDFTPMEFVVEALREHLGLDLEAAMRVMLQVHREGRAIAGRFPQDVSIAKVEGLREAAKRAGHPLRCVVEADAAPG